MGDLTQRRRMAEQLYHERILGITTVSKNINRPHPQVKPIPKCILALRKYVLSSSNGLQQKWHDLYIDDYSLFAPITEKADQQLMDYMNLPEVRKALHVEEAPIDTWERHPTGFRYEKEYYACNWSNPAELKYPNTTMVDIYQEIMLDEIDGGSYRPWF